MPTTPNRGWVYPTESQNPYFETIEDFFLAQDTDMHAAITGVRTVATGGTGAASFTSGAALYGNGTGPIQAGPPLIAGFGGGLPNTVWTLPGVTGSTATTSPEILTTYTLPAGALNVAGRSIEILYGVYTSPDVMTRTLEIMFGGSSRGGITLTASEVGVIQMWISRNSASDGFSIGLNSKTGGVSTSQAYVAQDMTVAIAIALRSTQTVATAGGSVLSLGRIVLHGT